MEATELVKRGTAYIEGIARVFEARNYLSIWVALVVAAAAELGPGSCGARLLSAPWSGPRPPGF